MQGATGLMANKNVYAILQFIERQMDKMKDGLYG